MARLGEKIRPAYEFGPFRLDPAERLLTREGRPVPLTPRVFDTLLALVERHGHLVEKDELMRLVWGDAFVEETNLARCVHTLRKALGEGHKGHNYVETVPKRGYRFVAGVKEVEVGDGAPGTLPDTLAGDSSGGGREDAVGGAVVGSSLQASGLAENGYALTQPSPSGTPRAAPARRRVSKSLLLVSSALVVAAAVAAYLYTGRSRRAGGDKMPINSVAVLPFLNGSGNPEVEYLADGLSESLINSFSELPQLKVIARVSSFKYKGKEIDPREVGRTLGVQSILTGSVSQRGDNLSVSVELVDARDGTQVWGGRYSRRAADIQAVQEEIARTVSEKLRLRLTGAQAQQLTRRATQNPQAYQLYLNGLYYWRGVGFENARRALDYFNQAVVLDPDFSLAWAGSANAYFGLAGLSLLDPKEALPKAKAAAQRALELDETLADAHSVLAGIEQDEWDWAGAELGHKRAVELNPNSADSRHRYARYLSVMGRHTEALAEVKRAQELDPLRVSLRLREGIVLYIARRYDEAAEKLRHVIELEPDHAVARSMLGLTYEARGMYEQAINEQQRAISIEREMTEARIFLGYALAKSGRRGEAQAILGRLKSTKEYVSPAVLATLYVGLGDADGAIASLERAYAAHDLQMQYLNAVPHFDSLRGDARFRDLVRRVGLPQ